MVKGSTGTTRRSCSSALSGPGQASLRDSWRNTHQTTRPSCSPSRTNSRVSRLLRHVLSVKTTRSVQHANATASERAPHPRVPSKTSNLWNESTSGEQSASLLLSLLLCVTRTRAWPVRSRGAAAADALPPAPFPSRETVKENDVSARPWVGLTDRTGRDSVPQLLCHLVPALVQAHERPHGASSDAGRRPRLRLSASSALDTAGRIRPRFGGCRGAGLECRCCGTRPSSEGS